MTSAISTIMVKILAEITPKSKPTLSTMSSINPRVFIKTPSAAASRVPIPVSRAMQKLPPNLPRQATAISVAHKSQSCRPTTSPSWVRSPL